MSRLAQDARYELTLKAAESEEERTARLEREGREHKVRLLKEVVLFFVALLGAGVIGWYCFVVLTDTAAPEGAKKMGNVDPKRRGLWDHGLPPRKESVRAPASLKPKQRIDPRNGVNILS